MLKANASGLVDVASTITQISSSGNTIVLDIGRKNLIKDKDVGVLVKVNKGIENETILSNIARIKLIKSYPNDSIWVITKRYSETDIVLGTRYILLTQSQVLRGRKNFDMTRTNLVTDYDEEVVDQIKFALIGEDSNLAIHEDEYVVTRLLHDKEKYFEEDVNIMDVSQWDEVEENRAGRVTIYRSPHAKEFTTKKRLDTFEKMMVNTITKNAEGFDPEKFYERVERDETGSNKISHITSSSTQKYYADKEMAEKRKNFFNKVMKSGGNWSEDYSDQELSEVITDLGLLNEINRQQQVVAYRYRYQIYASAASNFIQNQTAKDPDAASYLNYDFELGTELFPFRKLEDFNRYTFEINARYSKNTLSIGLYNAKATEISGALHVNWYPFSHPNTINENIVFFGILFRTGLASLDAPSLPETANYQVYTQPGIRGGIKYSFPTGWSLRMTASFEKILLDRLKSNNVYAVMPAREELIEGKVGFGIMRYYD
jgi:hypothetical protein